MDFEETLALYQAPTTWVDGRPVLGDATAVPGAGALTMNLHRGSRQAVEAALSIGLDVSQAAIGYGPPEMAPLLLNGRYLRDERGTVWRIVSAPTLRTRFEDTAHVRVLLQSQIVPPPGIPIPVDEDPVDQLP